MALLELTDVSHARPGEHVRAWYLDAPTAGTSLDRTAFELSGWAIGRHSPVRDIRLVADDVLLRRIPLLVPRPDVVAVHPEAPEQSGFWSLVGTVGLERDFSLIVRAVLEDETRVDLATIHGKRAPIVPPPGPGLRPLLLTSLGRTGTTLLMGLLSAHPEIVADRNFPYEVFPARYWLHLLRVLSDPADHADSSHPSDFSQDLVKIGSNPFHTSPVTNEPALADLLGHRYVERLARFCRDSIDDFYTALAGLQGKASAAFFAEKFQPDHVPRIARDLYPEAKEVFLVRDFRDLICSVLAFNEKRGTLDFGRERFESDEEYVGWVRLGADRLVNAWKSREATSHLVRYEDLATRPAETIDGVLEYLGVDRSLEIVDGIVQGALAHPETDGHRTTLTVEQSVGRWRRDLPSSLRPVVDEALGGALTELGYDSG
ncbi:MAG TPA: sulfotransferase [Gaiellaceae bacterium]